MILLDTHVWVWFVTNNPKLRSRWREVLEDAARGSLALSVMSCWEVAKPIEKGKLTLDLPVDKWLEKAVIDCGASVIALDYRIIADCTNLPGKFHRDPIDQIIVSTARIHGCTLMTEDRKILSYPHVSTFPID
jgi:PIN domain nuclease of toxin-antitoxin system